MSNSPPPSDIDKEEHYGEFLKRERWQDKLYQKLAHKSLDIPDDDMNLNVKTGMGWKELLAIGTVCCGGAGLASYLTGRDHVPPTVQPPAIERPAFIDTDTKPKLRFRMPDVPPPGGSE